MPKRFTAWLVGRCRAFLYKDRALSIALFLVLRLLVFFIIFLFVIFTTILHLIATLVVWILIKVKRIRELHALNHLLLEQKWIDLWHGHASRVLTRHIHFLLLLLLLLEGCIHLGLRLSLRLCWCQLRRIRHLGVLILLLIIYALLLLFCNLMHLLLFLLFLFALLRHPLDLLLHLNLLLLVFHLKCSLLLLHSEHLCLHDLLLLWGH